MHLRRELPADAAAVHAVHLAAFARPDGRPAVEAALLQELRADGDLLPPMCWVVEQALQVVAHVATSRARVGDDSASVVALGPIGVLPDHQRRGAGSALVHAVLAAADALDVHAVALLGDPGYYGRFGFVPGADLGVRSPEPAWGRAFQVRRLTAWDGSAAGPFRYAAAFGRL